MEETPQFSSMKNCTQFTSKELLSLNLSISITGGVCFYISLLVTLLLFYHNAYQSLLQRLFIYLMVATSLMELSLFSLIEHFFYYEGQEGMCIAVAFFNHWTVAMALVFTMGILIYMFYLVYRLSKGHTVTLTGASKSEGKRSKCYRYFFECLYVILLVIVTFAYGFEPYKRGKYGLAGAWCWIMSLDENCKQTNSGLVEQIISNSFILMVGTIGVILLIFTAVTYFRMQSMVREVKLLLRKTVVILICLVSFVACHLITINVRIFETKRKQYRHLPLWIVHAMAQSISFLLFPLGYAICFHLSAIAKLCHRLKIALPHLSKLQARYDMVPTSSMGETAPESTRVSQPSDTWFSVQYTGAFTEITEQDIQWLGQPEQ